jgi:hypothetical protein
LVADRFNRSAQAIENSQIQNVSGSCEGTHNVTDNDGTTYGVDTVVVSYLSTSQVQFYRANFTGQAFLDEPSAGTGLFDTYSACLAQLDKQQASFEAQTGLTAVATYCQHDTLGSKTFSLTVEGFGVPKAKLYEYTPAAEALQSKSTQLLQAAQLAITTSGGQLTYVDDAHVFYYSKYSVPVTEMTLGEFKSVTECSVQLEDAKAALSTLKLDNGQALCTDDGNMEIVGAGITYANGRTEDRQDRYASFEDCMKDKVRVVQNATSAGGHIVAALCSLSEDVTNDYVIDLYYAVNY